MNQKQYNTLLPMRQALYTAKVSNFARISTKEFDIVAETYKEMYGVEVTRTERSCSHCKLRVLKRVANDFFEAEERIEAKKKKKEEK